MAADDEDAQMWGWLPPRDPEEPGPLMPSRGLGQRASSEAARTGDGDLTVGVYISGVVTNFHVDMEYWVKAKLLILTLRGKSMFA